MAVDLDGTLLDSYGRVHDSDRKAIAALAARGVPTTILTGRLYSGARPAAAEIGVVGPLGCVDGCHLVDAQSGKDLWHGGLCGDAGQRFRRLLVDHRHATFLFVHDRVIYDPVSEGHLSFMRNWSQSREPTDDVVAHPSWTTDRGVTAVVSVADEAGITLLHAAVVKQLAGKVQFSAFPLGETGLWGAVARIAGYSKGTALVWVAKHHGISPAEVVAVGDWYNDLPMFEAAGRSFAMGQAPDDVKSVASDELEADSISGGGIAEAAERAGLL